MSNFAGQIEEIQTLISSSIKTNKSFAYSNLLHLQEQSNDDDSSVRILAENSKGLISWIIADIADDDEEIAAQALKCLGFMIYHPDLVANVSVDDANMVVETLSKLIITSKLKSVCNLGVWCISIQQFSGPFLDANFHSLLRAVVHALDNPAGSLSTTFEATQAVIKLAAQLSERMRDSSHIWAPPIYRRLLSIDKRERDMSERCLSRLRSMIIPPPQALSKELVVDMKKQLLNGMKELLTHALKVQTMQAWGWFIRLLGSYAMKCRHLVNDMLKIPEQTFSDHDPQVQIASQVAWEGLIDALIHPPMLSHETSAASENDIKRENDNQILENGFLKRLKLIMTPLIGIISSKCDVSVHSCCLNTWCHLLHKLDTSINFPPIIELVVEPILEVIFKIGPGSKSIWLWHPCVDLLDDFILAKCRNVNYDLNNQCSLHFTATNSILQSAVPEKCFQKKYAIKWLPWDLSQLEFHTKMIYILISQASQAAITCENRISACGAALRIFRSVLRVLQLELKSSSANYNNIMFCLNTILRLMRKICEDIIAEGHGSTDLHRTFLQFIEALTEELEPSILGSPLYKVALDLKCMNDLQSVNDDRHAKVLPISSISYMGMVSPVVYLTALYICVVVHSTLTTSNMEFILQGVQKYFKYILSSSESVENFHTTVSLLYNHMELSCIEIWISITKSLKDCIDGGKDLSLLTECDGFSICHHLSYPFFVWSWPQKEFTSVKISDSFEESLASSHRKLNVQHVAEIWKLVYVSIRTSQFECFITNRFPEDLCSVLNGCLDTGMIECGAERLSYKDLSADLLSLTGDVLICVLEQKTSKVSPDGIKNKCVGDSRISSCINTLGFAVRFMRLSSAKIGKDPQTGFVTSRVFSAFTHFISSLHLKQDILSLIEIISGPLVPFLSHSEIQGQCTSYQLQLFWTEILNCLRRSWPPINFDSPFLRLQAPLLEVTLEHPNPHISEHTISFWNSTYGEQIKLDYPQSLTKVLDKLSRNGRINLHKRRSLFLVKCHLEPDIVAVPQRNRVTATQTWKQKDTNSPSLKRKKLELTEHQKEVRRAQQGREMDCNGHGPGIRTYTNVDFSQGNEDSQESQELRNPELILEMLRKSS